MEPGDLFWCHPVEDGDPPPELHILGGGDPFGAAAWSKCGKIWSMFQAADTATGPLCARCLAARVVVIPQEEVFDLLKRAAACRLELNAVPPDDDVTWRIAEDGSFEVTVIRIDE